VAGVQQAIIPLKKLLLPLYRAGTVKNVMTVTFSKHKLAFYCKLLKLVTYLSVFTLYTVYSHSFFILLLKNWIGSIENAFSVTKVKRPYFIKNSF